MISGAAVLSNEPILRGVRRILVEQLEHTRKTLNRQPLSDENVHTIRKELKRARAGLRLLRDTLGLTEYRRLNRAVRDAARPLTPVRDANVLLQALDKVAEKTSKSSCVPIFHSLRHSLQQELRLNRTQLNARGIAAIRSRLNTVKQSLQDLSDIRLDQADFDAAIKRAHKKARRAFKAAEHESSDEILHEWRKQVKYEMNQLELLRSLTPKRIGVSIQHAHTLSDHLGDDHDFAILHDRFVAQSKQSKSVDAALITEALLKTLKPMRAKLQKKAHRLGKRLYANKAKAIAD